MDPLLMDPGTVVVVHGLGEHGGRYEGLAQQLTMDGYHVITFDHQGHGRSPGWRGCIDSYDGVMQDIARVLRDSRRMAMDENRSQRTVLLGHSMGGNLACNYALRHHPDPPPIDPPVDDPDAPKIDALVLSGPMFLPANPPPRPQIMAAWMTGFVLPWFRIKAPVRASDLTHDDQIVDQFREDPLVHRKISLYLGTQLLAQGRWALDVASKLKLPTLLLHGGADRITEPDASQSFVIRCGNNASLIIFDGLYHEIFHERQRQVVFDHLRDWLNQHWKDPASIPHRQPISHVHLEEPSDSGDPQIGNLSGGSDDS
ncbi:MAG: lysophospholipase [Planctomycetota bacterium]